MTRSFRIGTLFGFPIEINLSFLLILGIVLVTNGLAFGAMLATVLFGSVLLHELGHAVVARYLNVAISGIELHFFGGAAKMTSLPRRANDEIAIAAAGPAVSFILGGLGLVGASLTGLGIFSLFGWVNLILGTFNMLPALPMDGGRILRAWLTRGRSYVDATELAIKVARGFAIAFGLLGLYMGSFYLPLLAVLLWFMGTRELALAHQVSVLFDYDRDGYRMRPGAYDHFEDPWERGADEVEVLPADYFEGHHEGHYDPRRSPPHRPFFTWRPRRGGQVVLRQHNGRWYIETLR